jgi:hypothetical protein
LSAENPFPVLLSTPREEIPLIHDDIRQLRLDLGKNRSLNRE